MTPDWFGWAVFMGCGTLFVVIVLVTAPDGRRRKRRKRAIDYATKNRWQNRVRWRVAGWLNALPWTCWSNLVSWALHWRPLWSRAGDGDIRQDYMCQNDAALNGSCYCSKIRASE